MPELALLPDFKAQKIRLKIRRKPNFAAGDFVLDVRFASEGFAVAPSRRGSTAGTPRTAQVRPAQLTIVLFPLIPCRVPLLVPE